MPLPDRPDVLRRGLRLLAHSIRTQPRPFAVAVVGAALYGAMTVGSAVVLGAVTDRLVVPAFAGQRPTLGALSAGAAVIVAVAVLKAVGIVARRLGASVMQLRLQAIYRERVAGQYLRLPLAWHRRHPTGELLSVANADIEAAFWPIAPLPFSVGVAVMLIVTAVLLVATDPFLATVGFVVFPLIGVLNGRYNRVMQGPATRAQQERAAVSAVAHESFDGALVVKTLGREAAETRRFATASERLRDELVALGRLRATFDPLMEALPNAAVLLVLLVGAGRVTSGAVSPGELVRVAFLFTLLAFPVRAIGWLLSELPRAVVGWERVTGVLSATGELAYGTVQDDGTGPAAVALDEVTFTYADADEPVLDALSFAVLPGQTVAVVGTTGSGKSTIAALLLRLADPTVGAVRLDGRDLRDLAAGALPHSAAIVFQQAFLFDDTVRGNITLGETFSDEEVEAAARLAQAHEFVRALPAGYDTLVGERGTTLSGGQRQRIALARALVRRPRLLVLDDATSSVDTEIEAAILHGLKDAALPSTVVVIAYRHATIALAEEVVYVDGGRVCGVGTHSDLLRRDPAYARLVDANEQGAHTADAPETVA